MTTDNGFSSFLSDLNEWTVGIVYSFKPARSPTELWYDRWNSSVLSTYGLALQFLGVEPFYLDVNSFCERALKGSLPSLNCAFNLNAGIRPISNWALVPSVGEWASIPILPCSADLAILSERKDLSFLLAKELGLKTPKKYQSGDLPSLDPNTLLMVKPRDLGGSYETTAMTAKDALLRDLGKKYLIESFIPGYDLTVPVLFDPVSNKLASVGGILYQPTSSSVDRHWIHSRESKLSGQGYKKISIKLPRHLEDSLCRAAERFGVEYYCRFDLRLNHVDFEAVSPKIDCEDWYFIEINAMPTISQGINFLNAVEFSSKEGKLAAAADILANFYDRTAPIFPAALVMAATLYAFKATHGG